MPLSNEERDFLRKRGIPEKKISAIEFGRSMTHYVLEDLAQDGDGRDLLSNGEILSTHTE